MLYTMAVALLTLWLLGLATNSMMGGLIHFLLAIAIGLVVVNVISERKTGL